MDQKESNAFDLIKKMARIGCREYGFEHEWVIKADIYLLIIRADARTIELAVDRKALVDPRSSEFLGAARALLERLLYECGKVRDARKPLH